jgi:hypothetical protein
MATRYRLAPRDTAGVPEEEDEISPTRVRVGLGIIAAVMVVAIGVMVTVDQPAARFLFGAIIVIGLYQTWRIFRSQRRK